MIYGLQNSWREERHAAVSQLWRQLEREYGEAPSEVPSALLAGGGDDGEPAADDSEASADADALLRGAAEEAAERTAESEAAIEAAARDLEEARALRRRMEEDQQARRERASGRPLSLQGSFRAGCRVGARSQQEEEEEDRRLCALRLEIERMRANLDAQEAEAAVPPTTSAATGAEEAPYPEAFSASAPAVDAAHDLGALGRWVEDLRFLSAGVESGEDGTFALATGHVAETEPESLSTLGEGMSGLRLAGRHPVSPGRSTECQPTRSAVEAQLDDILAEFDEIDRIHAGVCRLTPS